MPVFHLETQQNLPLRIQGPGIGQFQVPAPCDPPDLAGVALASAASQPLLERGPHSLAVKGVPGGLDQDPDRSRSPGVAEQDPMDAGGQDLLHHPVVGLHGGLVDSSHRQRANHGRRPVSAGGGAAVHQPLHESPERSHVVGPMLHLVVDVVGPRPGQLAPLLVTAVASRVVDGLPSLQQLDGLVDPLRRLGRSRRGDGPGAGQMGEKGQYQQQCPLPHGCRTSDPGLIPEQFVSLWSQCPGLASGFEFDPTKEKVMHTQFALKTTILCLLWFVAQGQSPALASKVKVLVGAGDKKQFADLEKRLPNLELVVAGQGGIAGVIADCDAIIGLPYGQKGQEILRQGKKLRWVHSTSAGVEKIVHIPELRDSGIILTNAKIMMGPEIADHVFALLLALTRNLKEYDREMDSGNWMRGETRLPMIELRRKTMVIIGLGGIGSQVAQRAAAFDMRVLGVDPKDIPLSRDVEEVVVPDQLHRVLPEADVVVSCVPHTPASEGMLGPAEFAAMKEGVYVVNVSRGKVIRTDALLEALRSGKVRAAGLDVTDPEPLPAGHPLWKMDNVIITPHVATRSRLSRVRLANLIRDNIERFASGLPLRHVVNKAAGY